MFLIKQKKKIDSKTVVDEIENGVYDVIKQYGFKRYGRTLHRFVSGDISQVINFQTGTRILAGKMCVNLGIRVPECVERKYRDIDNNCRYYKEYECNIRSRIGTIKNDRDTWFDLSQNPKKIIKSIVKTIVKDVLPVYDKLSTRENILAYRRMYPNFDTISSHLILLQEAFIYARMGDMDKAREIFLENYKNEIDEYNEKWIVGEKVYMKKGDIMGHMGQRITATEDGYVTVYGTHGVHFKMLERLAREQFFLEEKTIEEFHNMMVKPPSYIED